MYDVRLEPFADQGDESVDLRGSANDGIATDLLPSVRSVKTDSDSLLAEWHGREADGASEEAVRNEVLRQSERLGTENRDDG